MSTFDDLRKYDGNPPEKALDRNKAVQTRYGYWKRSFTKRGTTPGQYILNCIFDNFENDRFVITGNLFPYLIADDVAHLVVWQNPLYDIDENEVRKYLQGVLGSGNFVLYQNKPGHQSILDVPHWQLFVQYKDINLLKIDNLSIC